MGYIYKNITAATATEVLPLYTIDNFTSISICNKGTDCTLDVYLCKIIEKVSARLSAAGISDKKEEVYFLYQNALKQGTTLILSPSDLSFDNTIYSLYIKGSQAVDVIINATASTSTALREEAIASEEVTSFYTGTGTPTSGGGY